jgi:trans-AT polyketide synthase/acyltransferase/oxidoreductase domain-containing protein
VTDTDSQHILGWLPDDADVQPFDEASVKDRLGRLQQAIFIARRNEELVLADAGCRLQGQDAANSGLPVVAFVPPVAEASLGDRTFCADYNISYPYVAGSMANGISSVELVVAMARAGMLGFFGAAGRPIPDVEAAIARVRAELTDEPFGFNLIHQPSEPSLEAATVDLYIRESINLIEASAFLGLTLPIVRYRLHGIHQDADGRVVTPNRVIAKVSRVEIASKFMSPPPAAMIEELIASGDLTAEQAELARRIPVAQDITAEADSGGHTDRRPAMCLIPTMLALRDRMQAQYKYEQPLRVGAAGGIATPSSVAAAFAMGAAYIVGGSVHQCTIEAGTSQIVREMLATTEQADTTMAPAADMFEMGVKLQVLKRGTMFPMRAAKLYEVYCEYADLTAMPPDELEKLEKTIFRMTLSEVWTDTESFFRERDPSQLVRAATDARHKMAWIFRWYLGQASRWANNGTANRQIDFQVWCGPAMGAFNEWVQGSFLHAVAARSIEVVARNLLYGAAVLERANAMARQGISVPPEWIGAVPRPLNEIQENSG